MTLVQLWVKIKSKNLYCTSIQEWGSSNAFSHNDHEWANLSRPTSMTCCPCWHGGRRLIHSHALTAEKTLMGSTLPIQEVICVKKLDLAQSRLNVLKTEGSNNQTRTFPQDKYLCVENKRTVIERQNHAMICYIMGFTNNRSLTLSYSWFLENNTYLHFAKAMMIGECRNCMLDSFISLLVMATRILGILLSSFLKFSFCFFLNGYSFRKFS